MNETNTDQAPVGPIAERLRDHVFGENGPTERLVNAGKFPDGWPAEYLRLLKVAAAEWRDLPLWPRELVAAVHFASWYLELRYQVWCHGTGRRDVEAICRPIRA